MFILCQEWQQTQQFLRHIKLPEDQFEIHWLEWMIPLKNESLDRLC